MLLLAPHLNLTLVTLVRTLRDQSSDSMKKRADECQKNCIDLTEKFRTRLLLGLFENMRVIRKPLCINKRADSCIYYIESGNVVQDEQPSAWLI